MGDEPREPEQLNYAEIPPPVRRISPMRVMLWGVIILTSGFFGLIFLATYFYGVARPISPGSECNMNLRFIGQALYLYAEEKGAGGFFPDENLDWRQTLIDSGNTLSKYFVCPVATHHQTCYFYVPGYGTSSDPNQVIAYENLLDHHGEGGNVLYVDGHVAYLKGIVFMKMIDSLKLPDGRPWAPHRTAKK